MPVNGRVDGQRLSSRTMPVVGMGVLSLFWVLAVTCVSKALEAGDWKAFLPLLTFCVLLGWWTWECLHLKQVVTRGEQIVARGWFSETVVRCKDVVAVHEWTGLGSVFVSVRYRSPSASGRFGFLQSTWGTLGDRSSAETLVAICGLSLREEERWFGARWIRKWERGRGPEDEDARGKGCVGDA